MFKAFKFSSLILPTVAMLALSGLAVLQKGRLQAITSTPSRSEIINQNKTQAASLKFINQLPTTSYRNLVADWLFLQYFQYFGDFEARRITGHGLIPDFFAQIVRHDPKFVDALLYISPTNSLYAGRPDQTVKFMSSGLSALSPQIKDAYYVWLYKGVDELLFLNNVPDAKNSYRMTSQWAEQQNDENSRRVSQSAQQTLQFLEHSKVSRLAQISAWLALLPKVKEDPNMVQFVIGKVAALGAKITVHLSNAREFGFNLRNSPSARYPRANRVL
jgi:hypothetical protein